MGKRKPNYFGVLGGTSLYSLHSVLYVYSVRVIVSPLKCCTTAYFRPVREANYRRRDVHSLNYGTSLLRPLITVLPRTFLNIFIFDISNGIYQLQNDEVEAIFWLLHHKVRFIDEVRSS